MKEQKKPRNTVIACVLIFAYLILDIVKLLDGVRIEVHEWLIQIGMLAFLLRLVYIEIFLPQKSENEPGEKKEVSPLFDAGYLTIIVIAYTPTMVVNCLAPEMPLLFKALCAITTIFGIWLLASGWVKYIRKR